MRLKRVERHMINRCQVVCKPCVILGAKHVMHWEVECYADLDAEPGTYYCQNCAAAIAPEQVDDFIVFAKGG